MHYVYRYICILNVFIYVYGQLSAIENLVLKNIKNCAKDNTLGQVLVAIIWLPAHDHVYHLNRSRCIR